MGDPYLDRGELFIVTTHRISADFALFDMMLTTRHLILVDNTTTRFEPDKIPLSTILSVTAGRVATGEPVITLTIAKKGDEKGEQKKNLLFTQQPGENRKRERDVWVGKLMDQIVIARHPEPADTAQPAEEGDEVRPSRAPSRPIEFALPHKSVIREEPAAVELEVAPEEPEREIRDGGVFRGASASIDSAGDVPDSDEFRTVLTAEGIPRLQTGEALGESNGTIPAMEKQPPVAPLEAALTDSAEEHAVTLDLPRADLTVPVPSETGAGGSPPALLKRPGLIEWFSSFLHSLKKDRPAPAEPDVPAGEPPVANVPPDQLPDVSGSEPGQPHAGILPALKPEAPEKESMFVGAPEQAQEPEQLPDAGNEPSVAEPAEITPSVSAPTSREVPESLPEPEQREKPGNRLSPEPAIAGGVVKPLKTGSDQQPRQPHVPRPGALFQFLAIAILIIIILALAGGVLFSFKTTPVGMQTPVTTEITPVITPAVASPSPTTLPDIIPAQGVWVRVTYNGSFIGYYGNPGALKHVGGSRDRFYQIADNNGLVQVSFQKQEYSGETMTIGVYRNGMAIYKRITRVPHGSLEFIIDAKTGEFPGGIPKSTSAT